MKRICVFCGSNAGSNPVYRAAAEKLGRLLAARGIELVYGAGNIGLMGAVADACLEAGGTVIGIIPEALMGKEVAGRAVDHRALTRIEIVDSMHTRKARMAELSDGFIALPGGFGTFEEFCEILTWGQLGFHAKPMGLLNVNGFYDPLLAMFDQAVAEGFLRAQNRAMALADTDIEKLLATMTAYRPDPVSKWLKEEKQL
ncbi:LOG family protein [Ferribacterium limneticum]|uniref:LOG family protein n=1 Tax=Ferribacterium limneticum TaxID=76259 RepID=UPI001CFC0A11|nr:TIGR00730 family Rossman fold protein [Ferribacterium limneticum]UCV19114.1 TIGR00730 family Rossman fold protein [Ferribacterium limneticum]